MDRQNETLRTHALGKFSAMLEAIIPDPAMLVWLDGGNSKKDKPNENFGREFLELFTLGAGHYSERDIREAARAFTGWVRKESAGGFRETPAFAFDQAQVDDGAKTFLGQTGRWGPSDIVRIVLARPEAAEFLARKLYRYFVGEASVPGAELIGPLAEVIQQHEFTIGPVVEVILRSRHFYSPAAYPPSLRGSHQQGEDHAPDTPRDASPGPRFVRAAGLRPDGPAVPGPFRKCHGRGQGEGQGPDPGRGPARRGQRRA
jgi:uncharacterized protein (DUF1800 family)